MAPAHPCAADRASRVDSGGFSLVTVESGRRFFCHEEEVMKTRNLFGLILSIMLLLPAAGSGLARGAQPVGYPAASGANVDPAATAPWFISTVDSALGVGQYVSVAIDDSGTTYISYYDATNTALKMAKYVGSGGNCGTDNAWECETVDGGVIGDMGQFSSIAIDPTTNLPVIAYWGTSFYLATALNGGGWDIITIDSGYGDYSSLKVDSTGAPHIAYRRYNSTSYLRYARPVSQGTGNCGEFPGNYQCDTIDSGSEIGHYPSLALDGSDQPRIAYRDGGNNALRYAYKDGGTWTIREILPTNSGTYASLDVDVNNGDLPHIAHYDNVNGKLGYAVYVGSNGNCGFNSSASRFEWQCDDIATMGTTTHPRTRDVSLAVGKAGFPIIAYSWYYGTPFSTRGFSWARPAAALGLQSGNCGPQDLWQCQWIQDGTYSGDYSAVAVHPSGLATIAYSHGEYFSTLRVAYQQFFQVFLPLVMKNQ
jgi:hypothetical protein